MVMEILEQIFLALAYVAEGLPPGISINTGTGTMSGTIAAGAMWRALKVLVGSDSSSPSSGATGLDRLWWLHASVPGG